jgi:hypothetical protein
MEPTQFKEFFVGLFQILTTLEFLLKSPYIHLVFGPPFTRYSPPTALFERGPQSKKVFLNLGMKC